MARRTIVLLPSHIITLILLSIYLSSSKLGKVGGFSIDLIHRDSPHSPLYKPHETPSERYNNVLRRSFSRFAILRNSNLNQLNSAQSDVSSDIDGEYLMKFSIGTPPFDVYAIADTGSDLTWVQCLPCNECFNQTKPFYDPKASSSYQQLPCKSQQCHLLDSAFCTSQQICNYTYGYGDDSLTKGILSTDTVSFDSSSSFPDIVFGCGHNNSGTFTSNDMGLVGLGGRDLSFASQINSRLGTKTFSHCLVPFHTNPSITSKLIFGEGSEVSGAGVVSTPLVPKEDKTYYYVTLQGISVGNTFISYSSPQQVSKGNIFIDNGTPLTLLPQDFYNRLVQEVKNQIKSTPYEDPQLDSKLCYKTGDVVGAPILTASFGGDAKVPLDPKGIFIPSPVQDVSCFAMESINDSVGLLGNYAQSDILIGFDLGKNTVSFKPTNCTK